MKNAAKEINKQINKRISSLQGQIDNREDLLRAIHLADVILVQPRYGLSEKWLQIDSKEAEYLIDGSDIIGCVDGRDLYLG